MAKKNNNVVTKVKDETYKFPVVNTGIPHYKRFQKILKMTQKELKEYLKSYLSSAGYKVIEGDGFLFAKGDVDILLTAHMDTTPTVGGKKRVPPKVIYTSPEGIVSSPQGIGGDDRCGIYIITEVIKETKCSVLFCEDEETGCVGSSKFALTKHIDKISDMRYMIEVDRRGKSDLVFYNCDNADFEDFLLDNLKDYSVAFGSCSDISVLMEESRVAGVNISCGYYDEHTLNETINLNEMENTLKAIKELVKIESPSFEFIDYYEGWGKYGTWSYDPYRDYGKSKSKTSSSMDYILYVVYKNGSTEEEVISYGNSYESAFFNFFQDYPNVCMNDVIDWYTDMDYGTTPYSYNMYY